MILQGDLCRTGSEISKAVFLRSGSFEPRDILMHILLPNQVPV